MKSKLLRLLYISIIGIILLTLIKPIVTKAEESTMCISLGALETNYNIYKVQEELKERDFVKLEEATYGKSGLAVKGDSRGTDLKYYKLGFGPNVLFTTFAVHGFEDSYFRDSKELTSTAEEFKNYLIEYNNYELFKNWTIYIFPTINPDGQNYGWTSHGKGRTTLYSAAPNHKGIDINRNFFTDDYEFYENSRNYNGTEPFQAYEAVYLRDFLLSKKSENGQTILVDLHGWLNQSIGDNELCEYYRKEFEITEHIVTYGKGYLVNWAKNSLGNSNYPARSALIELPKAKSRNEYINQNYSEKYIKATINMLESIL